jgi:hypothetical protein
MDTFYVIVLIFVIVLGIYSNGMVKQNPIQAIENDKKSSIQRTITHNPIEGALK